MLKKEVAEAKIYPYMYILMKLCVMFFVGSTLCHDQDIHGSIRKQLHVNSTSYSLFSTIHPTVSYLSYGFRIWIDNTRYSSNRGPPHGGQLV